MASEAVLGKDIKGLRTVLENPEISSSKAFKGLVELSVLLRLLTHRDNSHKYVPRAQWLGSSDYFDATDVLHVASDRAQDIEGVVEAVTEHFCRENKKKVRQVVAVPNYAVLLGRD